MESGRALIVSQEAYLYIHRATPSLSLICMQAAKKQHKYCVCHVYMRASESALCVLSPARCSRIKRKWSLRLDVIAPGVHRAPDFRSSLIAKSLAFIHSSTLSQTLWHVNIYLQVLMCQPAEPFPLNGANFARSHAHLCARYKFKEHSELKLKCPLLREQERSEAPWVISKTDCAGYCFSIQIRTLTLPMINFNFRLMLAWSQATLASAIFLVYNLLNNCSGKINLFCPGFCKQVSLETLNGRFYFFYIWWYFCSNNPHFS